MKRMVLWLPALALLAPVLLIANSEPAKEPVSNCPLPVDECLNRFADLQKRPWVGVFYQKPDSTGAFVVARVMPGSPAQQVGLKAGDVVLSVQGKSPEEALIAGKAGWRVGDKLEFRVRSGNRDRAVPLTLAQMTDEHLARLVGEHMVHAHLAYAGR